MNNTIRYIIAGVLIFLIILFQPIYLKWLGYGSGYDSRSFEETFKKVKTDELSEWKI